MRYIEMKQENYIYLMIKGLNSIIFSTDYDLDYVIVRDTIGLNSYNSILLLQQLVFNYRMILDNNMKENVSKLINYYRYNLEYSTDEVKNDVYERLNNIIYTMNNSNSKTKEYSKFIDEESEMRGIWSSIQVDGTLNLEFQRIKKYNEMDYLVLCLLTKMLEEETEQHVIETFSEQKSAFMYSINAIIGECPDIINNETALEMIKRVNDLLVIEIEKSETIDKKILKKEYKHYSKNINKLYKQKVLV